MSEFAILTTREVAAFLRCHPNTIYRMIAAGTAPPYFRVGGSAKHQDVRFVRSELERWMMEKSEEQLR